MNSNEAPTTPENIHQIHTRLLNLRQLLGTHGERVQKKRKTFFTVGIVLVVLSFGALSSLTSMAFKLDAYAVTQVSRLEIEKHIPGGRASLATHLKSQAPAVVKHTLRALIDMLPHLRTILLRDLKAKLAQITAEGEKLFQEQMKTSLESTKARLDETFPGLSDTERLEKLMAAVAADFTRNMRHSHDVIYPKYVAEMRRVQTFLDGMSTVEESRLTRKERIQKDLVQTLLRLMLIEQNRRGTG